MTSRLLNVLTFLVVVTRHLGWVLGKEDDVGREMTGVENFPCHLVLAQAALITRPRTWVPVGGR